MLREGDDFVSHLPIALDGSCSGLQHFGAMLRDRGTCEAVNVIQTADTPADVYTKVKDQLQADLQSYIATDGVDGEEADIAMEWLPQLARKVVKQPVMTTPYGVTAKGVVNQLNAAIGKNKLKFTACAEFEAAAWLGPRVSGAIGEVVSAAESAMGWLQDVARQAAKENRPVIWTTPTGFQVVQDYRTPNRKNVDLYYNGKRTRMTLREEGASLNKRQQANGAAPNFVHSMDASHMMMTVNTASLNGVDSFALIHDSFGTHAADTEVLFEALRWEFRELYSGNVLADFAAEQDLENMPPVPIQGSLDLDAVQDSEFFFS